MKFTLERGQYTRDYTIKENGLCLSQQLSESLVKSTCCFSRVPRFGSQDLMVAHIDTFRENTPIYTIKIIKLTLYVSFLERHATFLKIKRECLVERH